MECRRGLAVRILSVRLSVCPSVKRVHCNKTEEKSVQIFIPYKRSFSLVFWEEEWLVGATPSTWNIWVNRGPRWSEIADFEPTIARRDSAVTPSEKVQLILIGSSYALSNEPMDDHRTLPLSPPKGAQKTTNGHFSFKIAIRLKKVCYKVPLCKNSQRQSCRAFIGLTIRAKMISERWPFLCEILGQTDRVGAKSPILNLFSLVAPQPQHLAKSSINTNRKPTTRFPMSPRWTSYAVPKPPKGAEKRKVSKIWNNKLRYLRNGTR